MPTYRNLDAERIVETTRALQRRIRERFPDSGLSNLAAELLVVAEEAATLSNWVARPHLPTRVLAGLGILLIGAVVATALATTLSAISHGQLFSTLTDLLQGADAAINEIVVIGVAIFFLWSLERRKKRERLLRALHVLRSMSHIIDMHQLTKDPERTLHAGHGGDTPSSPARRLTPFELTRYLDYCSEALSVISKIAAIYVQRFDDSATLSAVNDIEDLTTGLSQKIWQKIMILDRAIPEAK